MDSKTDPFVQLRKAMAVKARERVLAKPHNKETWMYDRRPPLRFRASEAGSCARQIYLRLIGCVPKPDSPELILKQIFGNVAQDVVRGLFKEYGVPIGGITFHVDGTQKELLDARKDFDVGDTTVKVAARADGEFNGDTLFEFKTLDSKKHYWMEQAKKGHWEKYGSGNDATVKYIAARYPYYYDQVQITAAVFDKARTLFGLQNRDRVAYDSYIMTEDKERVLLILQKFAFIKRCVETETPPPPILAGSVACSWCPLAHHCPNGQETPGKVEYPE